MGDAVIVSAARTPIGTARRGSLVDVDAFQLAKFAIAEALKRSGLPPAEVDDVAFGESLQGGGDIARWAAVELGMTEVPGVALNRHCASSLAAISMAAGSIRSGMDRVVIAGGSESITQSPQVFRKSRGAYGGVTPWMSPSHTETPDAPNTNMSITVGENTARSAGVTREEQDHWAYHSHMRAVAAIDAGRFEEETFPVEVPDGKKGTRLFSVDEHPRRDTSLEKLAALPVLNPWLEGATVTAGNASGMNDGSCALVLTDADYAQENGLRPLAVIRSWAAVGVPPRDTGLAPTLAVPKALERAGLAVDDVELVEINEAFASMAVACSRILGFPHEIVNVNGSGCSLGHPVAATGARMVTTLVHELRRRGQRHGVATMCAGGGMGQAMVVEALPA